MSLESWAQNAWLKKQATSADEIRHLFRIVDRDLHDCEASGISADTQFTIAFNAALQAATAALRAGGYRTTGQGHHVRVIDSLELTINSSSATVQKLQILGRKRNMCSYDMAGSVSDAELQQMKKLALELRDTVRTWIKQHHPDLL
ncbi:MAG TPA: hypothetical protein VG897_09875 [Terriglobales bacterium]|nr:hypothetical protein [Terriglobales bacterium]